MGIESSRPSLHYRYQDGNESIPINAGGGADMVKFATAGSVLSNPKDAVVQAGEALLASLGDVPDYIMVQMNAALDSRRVFQEVHTLFPTSRIHGTTSCRGAMTDQEIYVGTETGLALMGLCAQDNELGVGLGMAEKGISMADTALYALDQAIRNAGRRTREIPTAVWLSVSPGDEESVIHALENRLGSDVALIGGSAADNDRAGQWSLFNHMDHIHQGCVISVFYGACQIGAACQDAYVTEEGEAIHAVLDADDIIVMQSNEDHEVSQGSRVCQLAQTQSAIAQEAVQAGILIYSAQCMSGTKTALKAMHRDVRQAMNGKPFITAFSFGQQGPLATGQAVHGNLRVSALIWGAQR